MPRSFPAFAWLAWCAALLAQVATHASAQDLQRLPPVEEYGAAPTWPRYSPPEQGYIPPPAPSFARGYRAPDPAFDIGATNSPSDDTLAQPGFSSSFGAPALSEPPPLQGPLNGPPLQPTLDLDAHFSPNTGSTWLWGDTAEWSDHALRVLPDGLLWKSFLASQKESRLSGRLVNLENDGTMFDGNLGGRFALWRYGTEDPFFPEGVEFDIEGAAQVRLDLAEEVDVRSVDFRAGAFFAWGSRWRQTKLGYYHLSSHLGDEFLIKNSGYPRLNFARDVLVLAHSIYLTEELRIYGEVGWAFWTDVTEPWELQFGFDYSPARPTGKRGAPFIAMNGHLREELDFSGNFTLEAGWAWRGDTSGNMFRMGLVYYNGMSPQYSFYNQFEEQIGFGIWYDR